jgi:hypothetical protein
VLRGEIPPPAYRDLYHPFSHVIIHICLKSMLPALFNVSVWSSRLVIEKENEMGSIVSMHGGNKKCIEKYDRKTPTEKGAQ